MLDLGRVLQHLRDAVGSSQPPTSGEVRAAVALVEDLRPLELERRAIVLRNSPRLQSIAVARRLLAVAAEDAGEDPRLALRWLDTFDLLADLPVFNADALQRAAITELSTLALVRRAVTMIKLAEYTTAEKLLHIADLMAPVDPETEGERLEAEALILGIRQDLIAALGRLEEAKELYRSIQDEHLVGRAFAAAGFAYGESRRPDDAVRELVEACSRIDPHRDRRLALATCFNLARYLRDAGRTSEALEAVALARGIFGAHARRLDRLHLQWLEAGLLADVGRFAAAASAYRAVVDNFITAGYAIEVSEVALEALESFSRAGRVHELSPLLAVAVGVFRSQGFEGERLAAWMALRDAAASGIVSAALVTAARAAAHSNR